MLWYNGVHRAFSEWLVLPHSSIIDRVARRTAHHHYTTRILITHLICRGKDLITHSTFSVTQISYYSSCYFQYASSHKDLVTPHATFSVPQRPYYSCYCLYASSIFSFCTFKADFLFLSSLEGQHQQQHWHHNEDEEHSASHRCTDCYDRCRRIT